MWTIRYFATRFVKTDRVRKREELDLIVSTIRQNTCFYIYIYIYMFVCVCVCMCACSFIYYVRLHYIFDVLMDGIQKFTLIWVFQRQLIVINRPKYSPSAYHSNFKWVLAACITFWPVCTQTWRFGTKFMPENLKYTCPWFLLCLVVGLGFTVLCNFHFACYYTSNQPTN